MAAKSGRPWLLRARPETWKLPIVIIPVLAAITAIFPHQEELLIHIV